MPTPYHFQAVFIPAEEGGYTVEVPELPGCISEGDTLEEAKDNIQEAIELYLEVMRDRGVPLAQSSANAIRMEIQIFPHIAESYAKTSRRKTKSAH